MPAVAVTLGGGARDFVLGLDLLTPRIAFVPRGPGQHATSMVTGGPTYIQPEYINLTDPGQPPFTPTPAGLALKKGAKAFWAHEMPVAQSCRPQLLVTVMHDNRPVPDACVYILPAKAAPDICQAMRTDANGTAWLQLRKAGVYRVFCQDGTAWKKIDVTAKARPLDLTAGGIGPLQHVELALSKSSR
jgi:hypothetical protein